LVHETRGRHNNFDGLRLLGALLVLFSHQFALSGRWEPRFLGDHSFGNLGVLIFFSISGYLIAASWERDPSLKRFLAKRFLRMVPALAVAIPLAAGLVFSLRLWKFPENPLHALNGSLWTIPIEIYCYLILVGVALLTKHSAVVIATLAVIAHLIFDLRNNFTVNFIVYFGMFFAVGALLYRFKRLQNCAHFFVLVGVCIIAWSDDTALALAVIVPPIVVFVGLRSWRPMNLACKYGDLSYGIYIYAWPVQQIGVAYMPDAPYLLLFSVSLPVTMSLAWLSWHCIENRALKLKPLKPVT